MHIRITMGTNFQLEERILIIWTKFTQKKIFPVKTKKSEHHH